MQEDIREFLESLTAYNTRKGYLRSFELFEEFTGRTISETVKIRRENLTKVLQRGGRQLERETERFYNWIIEAKQLKPNTAYNCVVALKSLMSFYGMSLKLRRGTCPRIPTMPNDWISSIDQLRLMFQIGNLREKTIISMAKDIPLRIGDFLSIKRKDVEPLLGNETTDDPVDSRLLSFTIQTKKTKTPMTCFISEETLGLLKIYCRTLCDDNPFLWQGKDLKRLNEDSVNLSLKNLVKKAGIETHGLNVRFHMFRKLFVSVGASLGLNTDILKALTGKRIKSDMQPYYQGVNLHEQWKKVNDHLRLSVTRTNGRISNLQEALDLVMKTLRKMVERELKREGYAEARASLRDKTDKETLENYLETIEWIEKQERKGNV